MTESELAVINERVAQHASASTAIDYTLPS